MSDDTKSGIFGFILGSMLTACVLSAIFIEIRKSETEQIRKEFLEQVDRDGIKISQEYKNGKFEFKFSYPRERSK